MFRSCVWSLSSCCRQSGLCCKAIVSTVLCSGLTVTCPLYSKQGRETGFILLFTAPNGASEQTLGIFLRNGPHKNLPSLPWSLLKSHYPYFICHGIDVTVSSPVWEFSLPMWFRPHFSLLWGLRDGDPVFAAVLEGTSCRCATLTVTLLGSIPGTLFLRKPLMGKPHTTLELHGSQVPGKICVFCEWHTIIHLDGRRCLVTLCASQCNKSFSTSGCNQTADGGLNTNGLPYPLAFLLLNTTPSFLLANLTPKEKLVGYSPTS